MNRNIEDVIKDMEHTFDRTLTMKDKAIDIGHYLDSIDLAIVLNALRENPNA